MGVAAGNPMTVVIVGLGPAGLAAAEQARAAAPAARIVAISEEPFPAYYRPQLSHRLAAGTQPESLLIKKHEWYEQNRIELVLGRRVERLDTSGRRVELSNGDSIGYDSCVLSMGSSSFLPPVRGNDLDGVFTLRSIADAEAIRSALKESHKPVVIGGGPLGLEAAWAIASAGGDAVYTEPELTMMINILGVTVASIGEIAGEFSLGARPDEGCYLRVFFRGDAPVGAAYIGDSRRVPTLRQGVIAGRPTPAARTLGSALELLSLWSSSR